MSRADTMHGHALITAKNVDLSNCDRELVQYPGAIQGHGAMLIVDEAGYIIRQASENCAALIGRPAADLLGKNIEEVFGPRAPEMLEQLNRMSLENGPVHVVRESFAGSAMGVNIFAHRCDGALILELEVISSQPSEPTAHLYSQVRETIAMLEATSGVQNCFDLAVQRIRSFTGYDRVMAYRFAEDGSGQVVAEAKCDTLEPYLGLHYPATDIPAPARRLFGLSWLRHLPDVDYVQARLVPETNPVTGRPVDMSYAILRSVSAMYTGYLKNMGVHSTMVMPLMKEGELWGLISAMHHSGPRHVPYEARMAAEFLAHMLSMLMAGKENAESYSQRLHMTAVTDQLVEALCRDPNLHACLGSPDAPVTLLSLLPAQGAAVVSEGRVSLLGATPSRNDVIELAAWLSTQNQLVFNTDRLPEMFPAAAQYKSVCSGILSARVSTKSPEFLIWFRPEQIEVVNWAGDPKKPVKISEAEGELRLQPRNSFALWKESVLGRSEPWKRSEKEAVANLRQAILDIIISRAEEIQRINQRLSQANEELDSFAYVASHDLKEPLRGVHHMASFLKRGKELELSDASMEQVDTILKLTRRMDDLIESLLQYSRTGRVELVLEPTNLDALVDEAFVPCRRLLNETGADLRRPAPLGSAICDRVRIREVLTNLISNALKYNDKEERWVEIGVEDANPPRYYVRDNGIGISEESTDRIFEIFRRVHDKDKFGGGNGAGLTIARRTIERHGGKLWVESEVDQGSTFYFTLSPETP